MVIIGTLAFFINRNKTDANFFVRNYRGNFTRAHIRFQSSDFHENCLLYENSRKTVYRGQKVPEIIWYHDG